MRLSLPQLTAPRQGELEGAALAQLGLDADGAAVGLDDHPADVQPQPEPRLLAGHVGVDPEEAVEQLRALLERNAQPLVRHRQPHLVGLEGERHLDRRAFGRVLEGVVQEVGDHLLDAGGVGVDQRRLGGQRQDQLPPRRPGAEVVGHGGDQAAQVERHRVQLQPPPLEARGVEQVVHHVGESARLALHALQGDGVDRLALGQAGAGVLHVQPQRGQRGAQLVRSDVQELGLGAVGGLGAVFGLMQGVGRLALGGDVLDHPHAHVGLALFVLQGRGEQVNPDALPVLADVALLQAERGQLPRQHGLELCEVGSEVIGVGDVGERLLEQLFLAVPDHGAQRLVDPQEVPARVDDCHAHRPVFEDPAEALLAVEQRLVGAAALDAQRDGVGDRPQGLQRGLGQRPLREHRHHADQAVFDDQRVAGERDQPLALGPGGVDDARVAVELVGEHRPPVLGDEADLRLAHLHPRVRAVDAGVQPGARLQLELSGVSADRPDAGERGVQVLHQHLGAALERALQRLALDQRRAHVSAQRRQPLALEQGVVGPLARGDVANDAQHGRGLACAVPDHRGAQPDGPLPTFPVLDEQFALPPPALTDGWQNDPAGELGVDVQLVDMAALQLRRGEAVDALDGPVRVGDLPLKVDQLNAVLRLFDGAGEHGELVARLPAPVQKPQEHERHAGDERAHPDFQPGRVP